MTQKSLEAFQSSLLSTQSNQNPSIEPIWLILSILKPSDNLASQIVDSININKQNLIKDLEEIANRLPKVSGSNQAPFPSNDLISLITTAEKIANKEGDSYISTEHFILAIFSSSAFKKIKTIFEKNNLSQSNFKEALNKLKGDKKIQNKNPENQFQVLEKYTRDLTKLAEQGKLDPVIGRDKEIRRVIQVLSRRTKNNPVLIGEPGVGKTAIAEGLALRILKKRCS